MSNNKMEKPRRKRKVTQSTTFYRRLSEMNNKLATTSAFSPSLPTQQIVNEPAENLQSPIEPALPSTSSDAPHDYISGVRITTDLYSTNESSDMNNDPDEDEILFHQKINRLDFLDDLRQWALNFKIPLVAVTSLLKLLNRHGVEGLPLDARTLVKTPIDTIVTQMGANGDFWYDGIKSNLEGALAQKGPPIPSLINLQINADGVSPFNSTGKEFWPISFRIYEAPWIKPMFAAIYYGFGKPPLEEYLERFIEELLHVLQDGITVSGQNIGVKVMCFVCDTPARVFLKGIQNI